MLYHQIALSGSSSSLQSLRPRVKEKLLIYILESIFPKHHKQARDLCTAAIPLQVTYSICKDD
jgi:hypothetical protein